MAAALRGEWTVPGSRDWPGQRHAPDRLDTPGQLRPASSRPDSPPGPERSDETRPTDRLASDDQQVRWSRDDLRQRLERLPPGHPSSPRGDAPDRDQPDQPSSREKAEQASSDRREAKHDGAADAANRDFWTEEPRFLRAWTDHLRSWPVEQSRVVVDRSRDPAGSWRGDGGRYLDPEQHRQTKDAIVMVQRREETLTEAMGETERQNAYGGWLVGLEHRLKEEDRLKEKIADLLDTAAPDATTEEISRQISDAMRYTFCAQPETYREVYWDIKGRLEERGYEMWYSENHWSDTQYKGINTRWVTPEGERFEVQFHSPESFHAKQRITHEAYERLRNPLTQDGERRELVMFQQEVCSWIRVPAGAEDIPNYRKEGD
jgi:hypothetical protein